MPTIPRRTTLAGQEEPAISAGTIQLSPGTISARTNVRNPVLSSRVATISARTNLHEPMFPGVNDLHPDVIMAAATVHPPTASVINTQLIAGLIHAEATLWLPSINAGGTNLVIEETLAARTNLYQPIGSGKTDVILQQTIRAATHVFSPQVSGSIAINLDLIHAQARLFFPTAAGTIGQGHLLGTIVINTYTYSITT